LGYLRLFLRGFLIVMLTATQVRLIAAGAYGPAFLAGCSISAVWWFNSRSAAHSDSPAAWMAYSLGAGVGTMFGMWFGGLWSR
jgi:hypothetical protein